MQWIAPSEKDLATDTLEKRLWAAADQFRANSGLSAAQYSQPVLGLIFLRFAEVRFAAQRSKLERLAATGAALSRRSLGVGGRLDEPAAYHADGILYLAPNVRFDFLLQLAKAADSWFRRHRQSKTPLCFGGPCGIRTHNQRIMSPLL